jgi:hypothetical protein
MQSVENKHKNIGPVGKKIENFTADQITGLGLTGSSCFTGKIDEALPAGCMCTTGDNNKIRVWARTGIIYGCK